MTEPLYQPFYCEENVWHLARSAEELDVADPQVVFISSPNCSVAMWAQRAGSPIVWDYHVVLMGKRDGQRVWDLDTTAGFGIPLHDWLEASFPLSGVIPPELEPTFRLVDAATFLHEFKTDRRHMRDGADWKAPPPPWPPITEGFNLWDFVDPNGDAPGSVTDLLGMRSM